MSEGRTRKWQRWPLKFITDDKIQGVKKNGITNNKCKVFSGQDTLPPVNNPLLLRYLIIPYY
jgi:hypothetical protein